MKRAAPLVFLLALCGCLEEQVQVHLQADGRARLRLDHVMSQDTSDTLRFLCKSAPDQASVIEPVAAGTLARWSGVACWSEVEARFREDGRLRLTATGWCEDLGRVERRLQGESRWLFRLERRDEGLSLRFEESDPAAGEEVSLFERDGPALARARELADALLNTMLRDYRQELRCELPGTLAEVEGFARSETALAREVFLKRGPNEVRALVAATFAEAARIQPALERGELDAAGADALLRERMRPRFVHRAACARSDPPDPAFDAAFARARAAWAGSRWRTLIDELRAGPRPAGPTPRATPTPVPVSDRFEPNETRAAATLLEPGRHAELQCSGQDWYRFQVPADHELEVSLGFDAAAGDLDLELLGPQGASASRGGSGAERAALMVLERAGEVAVQVHGTRSPYVLEASLVPAPPPDVYEPNDTPRSARALGPGAYAELRCNGRDHYRVHVPAGHELEVGARFDPRRGELELSLIDPKGRPITAGRPDAEGQSLAYAPAEAQNVLVRVRGGPAAYALRLGLNGPPPPVDRYEPNDGWNEAATLAPGEHGDLHCNGEDYYRIELGVGQTLVAVLAFDPARTDLALELFDARGQPAGSSAGAAGRQQARLVARTAGPHRLRVYRGIGPYRLTLRVEDPR